MGFEADLYEEHLEVHKRINKLTDFIVSESYLNIPDVDRKDLREQLTHMKAYYQVLTRRVSRSCGNA